jgi:uncharacterized protein YndB with AHSA1/START domain
MVDILHRLGISAPPTDVYEAFATIDGLSRWWTETVTGNPTPGGRLTFTFGAPDRVVVVEVLAAIPDTSVVWRCVGGPSEWVDTTMTFALEQSGDETVLRFAHAGWREQVEFMGHCSSKWAYFLFGLKAGFEGGKATPFPHDEKISNWG